MQALLEGKRFLIPVALLLLAGVIGAIFSAGGYLAALPMLMNPTADVAFILFSVAFSASSLGRLIRNDFTRFMIRNRRYIGLSFAMVHFVHLALVLSNITMIAGEERDAASVVPGAIAYAFIAAMTLTSSDAAVRMLGAKRWKLLHKTGSYYIWLIFLATTLPPSGESAWMLLISVAVPCLRIASYQRARSRKVKA